jgi:hypothetical protein
MEILRLEYKHFLTAVTNLRVSYLDSTSDEACTPGVKAFSRIEMKLMKWLWA